LGTDFVGDIVRRNGCILGAEVAALEAALGDYLQCRHAVACSSGTDALLIGLMALGVKPGQVVVCPSLSFVATAETVALLGAIPVFADIERDTYNISIASVRDQVGRCRRAGYTVAGVIGVDLYGRPFDREGLSQLCRELSIWLVADAAQSFGATCRRQSIARAGAPAFVATSFYPYKPLGCYGDGGAIFTDDAELADRCRSIGQHGYGGDRFNAVRVGLCARLDTVQAAVLLAKLTLVDAERERRAEIARRYTSALEGCARVSAPSEGLQSAHSVYTIRVDPGHRDAVIAELGRRGVETRVYYRKPIHRQLAYSHHALQGNDLPATDAAANAVVSLPCFADLADGEVDQVIEATRSALAFVGATRIRDSGMQQREPAPRDGAAAARDLRSAGFRSTRR
jgi:dTDP-4-amino-4,6-dideoxygalactose transaminase